MQDFSRRRDLLEGRKDDCHNNNIDSSFIIFVSHSIERTQRHLSGGCVKLNALVQKEASARFKQHQTCSQLTIFFIARLLDLSDRARRLMILNLFNCGW